MKVYDHRTVDEFLLQLPQPMFLEFRNNFGGDAQNATQLLHWMDTVDKERKLCDAIARQFGVNIRTATDRQEAIAAAGVDAALRQAAAAEAANATSREALQIAKHSLSWSIFASIVAGLAFLAALWGFTK